jgi:hypothetical protein
MRIFYKIAGQLERSEVQLGDGVRDDRFALAPEERAGGNRQVGRREEVDQKKVS